MARLVGLGIVPGMLSVAARPAGPALAHDGLPPAPHDLWGAWTLEPALLLGLVVGALAYHRGLVGLWARAGFGSGVRVWQGLSFAGGMLTLIIALVSPLDALGSALFAAHMAQHMLLVIVAAPLLVLGRPIVVFSWAAAGLLRRRELRAGTGALLRALHRAAALPAAVALHVVTLWAWHAPPLYEAALWSEAIHAAEHACFLGTALLAWWAIVHSSRRQALGSTLALFALTIQGGLLGALMTFAPTPWYPAYAGWPAAWGLTPLEDQQIAGVIMWLPGGVVYLVAALALLADWLRRDERRAGGFEELRASEEA